MDKLLLKSQMTNQPVDIIYMDSNGRFTQRTVYVRKIEGQKVIAFCTMRKQHRTFQLGNILSVSKGKAGFSKRVLARKVDEGQGY